MADNHGKKILCYHAALMIHVILVNLSDTSYQNRTSAWYEAYQTLVSCIPHCGLSPTKLWSFTDRIMVARSPNCGRYHPNTKLASAYLPMRVASCCAMSGITKTAAHIIAFILFLIVVNVNRRCKYTNKK